MSSQHPAHQPRGLAGSPRGAEISQGEAPGRNALSFEFPTSSEQNGDAALVAIAHAHLAWVLAHQGDVSARPHAEMAWEYFAVHQDAAEWVWHTAVTLSWLRASEGSRNGVDEVLALGIAAWKRAGRPPFTGGSILFEFDHDPTLLAALESCGLHLEREAGRAVDSANRIAAAAAHGCLARLLRREPSSRNRQARVALHLTRAVELLREAGATGPLASALAAAATQADILGEPEKAATLRREQAQLQSSLSSSSGAFLPSDIAPPPTAALHAIDEDWVQLDEVERRYIADVLRHTHGRITGLGGAAAILGLNPSTLSWRIDKLGLRESLAEIRRTSQARGPKSRRRKG